MEHSEVPLAENFQRYFDVHLALLPEEKEQVYKIRYRVYCAELKYEDPDRFPDKLEIDEFDKRSLHCLVTHKATGLPAGCVRLVSTLENHARHLLPLEKFCLHSLDKRYYQDIIDNRDLVCEISRLAVDGTFRRRNGEWRTRLGKRGATDVSHQEERAFSLVALAGVLAGTAMAQVTGRTNVFAMMEPYLPRLLRRSGLYFKRAGKTMDYHGHRAPYFIQIQTILDNMHPDLEALYETIYRRIDSEYHPELITAT